jgi:hypothetical protein
MADIETLQEETENKLFDFIEENFGKKRWECFNEVRNFVEDKLISDLSNDYEEIENLMIDNDDLESAVETLSDAFNSLKNDCVDALEDIESELENIIENNELDSTLNKLKELKKIVAYQHNMVENMDCC